MNPRIAIAVATLLSLSCGSDESITGHQPAPDAAAPAGSVVTIFITDDGFSPSEWSVRSGQTVRWVNTGTRIHNVTELDADAVRSGSMEPGAIFQTRLRRIGSLKYRCEIHRGLEKGKISVAP